MKKINKIFLSSILTIISLSLISCGKGGSEQEIPHYTERSFQPFIDQFKGDAQNSGVDIGDFNIITVFKIDEDLKNQGNDIDSVCIYHLNDKQDKILYKEIVFKPEILEYPEYLVYKVFLHEVGHCAYHLSDKTDFYSWKEIMYPQKFELSVEDFNASKLRFFNDAKNNMNNWYNVDNF